MAITRRLGILGVLAYGPGEQVSTAYGEQGVRWLVDPGAGGSIVGYWRDATGGYVDLSSSTFLRFLILQDAALRDALVQPDRRPAAQAAVDVALRAGVDLSGYDGLVIVVAGREVDGGATSVRVEGRFVPCAYLGEDTSHSFMAHEVGHVIGLDHSFRPAWTNPQPGILYGEYGDPADIMSAETFGNRPTTFALPHDRRSGIGEQASLWRSAGPGVSPASVWRYGPEFPAPAPFVRLLPPRPSATRVRLSAPSAVGATTLVAVPFPAGGGFTTIEYRRPVSWDRGLRVDAAEPSGSPGIVVHQVRDVGVASDPPAGTWPRLQRICHHATIPVPSTGDDDWDDGRIAVRIEEVGETSIVLLVGETLPGGHAVRLVSSVSYADTRRTPGPTVALPLTGKHCGVGRYPSVVVQQRAVVGVAAASVGYDAPQVQFSLNGVDVGGWRSLTDGPTTETVSIPVRASVPTGVDTSTTSETAVLATVTVVGNTLSASLRAGTGTFGLQVRVRARGDGIEVSSSESVTVTTLAHELSEAARGAQRECARFLVEKGLQRRPLDVIPDIWHAIEGIRGPDDWVALDPDTRAEILAGIASLERWNARQAREHTGRLVGRLGVQGGRLQDLVGRIERVGPQR